MAQDLFRVAFPLEAFDGGLNTKYEPNVIANEDSPDAKNVSYDDRGGVQTRLGASKFNTALVGTNAAGSATTGVGLFSVKYNNGTEAMIGFWNGSGFSLTGNSTFTTIPSAQSVFTVGTRVFMFEYQDHAFFGNGFKSYKYNSGGDFTLMGVSQPGAGMGNTVKTPGVNGPRTGDVNYKVSWVNSATAGSIQGDVSVATTTLTLGSTSTVSLAAIPLAPQSYGVAARKLYRRDVDTAGAYKFVATISDNTTQVYEDTVNAASLGATAPTDNGMPPTWGCGVAHQDRVWMNDTANPQLLWYSETAAPYTVASTNFIRIGKGDGESIRGITVHANNVNIYKDESVWVIYLPDDTPGNWIRIKTNSKYGGWAPFAADYGERQMFIAKRNGVSVGFFALTGSNTEPNAVDLPSNSIFSESKSDKIEPNVIAFSRSGLINSHCIEYKNRLWFAVPTSTSTTNDTVYVYDFQRRDKSESTGAWSKYDYPDDFACFCVYSGGLYAQSATTGQVYKLEQTGYADWGNAIDSYAWTKEFYGFEPHQENWKEFRWNNFIAETLGVYYMDVSYVVDGDSGSGIVRQVSLDPGGTIWGSFIWGSATWGGGATRENVRIYLSPSSGKRIQIKFSNQNTVNQGFHVLPNASIIYNLRGRR